MIDTIGTYVLDAVLAAALGVLLKYGVPYIKSLITAKNLAFIKTWVDTAVAAAEQTITGSGMGAEKKAWVIALLEKMEIIVDDTVDALIEAAVNALAATVDTVAAATTEAVTEATDGAVTAATAEAAVASIASAVESVTDGTTTETATSS